jgi:ribosomal protein S18 acetylase RimI-like enzyme
VDDVLGLWAIAAENASRPTDTARSVHSLIERDPEALLLAHFGETLVGSVIAGWDGWRSRLYRLAVRPDRRKLGIAGLLLDRAEARLVALGAVRIEAMVLDGNDLGRSLWTARGYQRQPDWSRWVKPV